MGKKSKASPEAPSLVLRVRAEGAQGIAAATGMLSVDKKPDPYATFVFGGVTRECAHIDDVEPMKFFSWPDAVAEFAVADEAALAQAPLVVHVKDKDLLKDRYIGGAKISLGELVPAGKGRERVMCQSRMFSLEFADEKLSKKKASGEIKMTITLVDTRETVVAGPPPTAPATSAVVNEPTKKLPEEGTAPSSAPVSQKPVTNTSPSIAKPQAPSEVAGPTPPAENLPSTSSNGEGKLPNSPATLIAQQGSDRSGSDLQTKQGNSVNATLAVEPSKAPEPQVETASTAAESPASVALASNPATAPLETPQNVKHMSIELVSARNLTRPASLGAIFDRKPDPFVVLTFCGATMASVPLKDVDLKHPVNWKGAILTFDLSPALLTLPRPKGVLSTDLLIHVKDENLTKPTYMGGAKISLGEFFSEPTESSPWCSSQSIVSGTERTYPLTFSDERFTKRKACGELTVRFHFEFEQQPPSVVSSIAVKSVDTSPATENEVVTVDVPEESRTKELNDKANEKQTESLQKESVEIQPPKPTCTDVKALSIEPLCARQLRKPTAGGVVKGMVKALFDRKPDPYVVFMMNGQTKKSPSVKDADVAFVEWTKAAQVFDIKQKPYPLELVVHIRDQDVVGKDPYMGGARISLESVWKATADQAANGETVSTFPLDFVDEKMSKSQHCGEITLRFRWIYADTPLPTTLSPVPDDHQVSPGVTGETTEKSSIDPKSHRAPTRLGYLHLANICMRNNPNVVSASHDLYVEVTCFPAAAETSSKQRVGAATRTITDATKGVAPDAKVEWTAEELIIPLVVADGEDYGHAILVELKDKNAITRDVCVAQKRVSKAEFLVSIAGDQPKLVQLELSPATIESKKTSQNQIVTLEVQAVFLPLDAPKLLVSPSEGCLLTFFATQGVFIVPATPTISSDAVKERSYGLAVQLASQKKPGLLSFSRSHTEDQLDFHVLRDTESAIVWNMGVDLVLSSNQYQTAKEKETLDLDIQMWSKGVHQKKAEVIGSCRCNVWAAILEASGFWNGLHRMQIPLGPLGHVELSYGVAHRKAQSTATAHDSSKAYSLAKESRVGSGNLHLLVMYAQQLVAPNPSDERAAELDPEVRISIEPKYIKRKDNPVRSMLKTRPLENVGASPTWNEYLRLEYRLPHGSASPSSLPAETPTAPEGESISLSLPPPIVSIGIYDIQIPGEKNGSAPIGKTELPLSAFCLPRVDAAVLEPLPIFMTVDVFMAEKKTGRLVLEGVFEPLAAENESASDADKENTYRSLCREVGKSLRDKSKSLKTSGSEVLPFGTTTKIGSTPGRLDVLLDHAQGPCTSSIDDQITAHIWLNSTFNDKKEVKSRMNSHATVTPSTVLWDCQITLYTDDIATDILRVELLTSTGKSIGSLKQPIGSLSSRAKGVMSHEWYPFASSTTAKVLTDQLRIGLAFYPDQVLRQPVVLETRDIAEPQTHPIVLVRFGRLILAESGQSPGVLAAGRPTDGSSCLGVELTCKAALFGARVSATPVCTSAKELRGDKARFVEWDEVLHLNMGCTSREMTQKSYDIGTCPVLRLEVLSKRTNARFQELVATYEVSLAAALENAKRDRVHSVWATLFSSTSTTHEIRLAAVVKLDIAVCETLTQAATLFQFPQMVALHVVPGVLCVRFIAGRNLTDVDASGEQDPYVVAKVLPLAQSAGGLVNVCQTGISLNGGRHPQWNSPIYYLRCNDLHTDYLRLEVVDSNEDDHLPDASIGTLNIAVSTLFHSEFENDSQVLSGKTNWLESWLPIYPPILASSNPSSTTGTKNAEEWEIDTAGDIRMEYRFVSRDYFEEAQGSPLDAVPISPYTTQLQRAGSSKSRISGSFYCHIVRAQQLPCSRSVQPAVRISCHALNFVQVTKVGQESIHHPVWDGEVMEIEYLCDQSTDQRVPLTLTVEIVDLAVRTANVNALAVISFGSVNMDAFLSHPTAVSYTFYPLGNVRKAETAAAVGAPSPSTPWLLMGCQFIPSDKRDVCHLFQQFSNREHKLCVGQLHVKVLQARLNIATYFHEMMVNKRCILRFKLVSVAINGGAKPDIVISEKTLALPPQYQSLDSVVAGEGLMEWERSSSTNGDLTSVDNALLFECAADFSNESASSVVANPILVCELLICEGDDTVADSDKVIGELELPIFDFMLLDGHLASGWYPLTLPPGLSNDEACACGDKSADLKLEVQFLPTITGSVNTVVEDSSRSGELAKSGNSEEHSNGEVDANRAKDHEETAALLLAEGAATLKKTFVALGGGRNTAISIAQLKHYLLGEHSDSERLGEARHVVQQAAEKETNGDLDKLFVKMDVNGDGMISWDEYVSCMQHLYSLADAASLHSEPSNGSAAVQLTTGADNRNDHDTAKEPSKGSDEEQRTSDIDSRHNHDETNEHVAEDKTDSDDKPEHSTTMDAESNAIEKAESASAALVGNVQLSTPVANPTEGVDNHGQPLPSEEPKQPSPPPTNSLKSVTIIQSDKESRPSTPAARKYVKEIKHEPQRSELSTANPVKTQSGYHAERTRSAAPSRKPLSTDVLDWKVEDVVQWLEEEMQLGQYAEAMVRNAVNGKLLLTLSESELESEIGVTTALHKRKLMTHIAEFQEAFNYPPKNRPPVRTTSSGGVGIARYQQKSVTETPSFIRREQLLYQTKQRASGMEDKSRNADKPANKRPKETRLVYESLDATGILNENQSGSSSTNNSFTASEQLGESYVDAMQDILETVGISASLNEEESQREQVALPKLPMIQVGSITSTDELFEIVKKRVHQLASLLLPQSRESGDSFSDFGGDDDDPPPHQDDQELTGLHLVFDAMAKTRTRNESKLSRIRFQESLLSLLAVDVSWHQFDVLFRRVDVSGNAELSFDEFQRVFQTEYASFNEADVRELQDALVDFVIDRLDSQQWTLLELFKAFDRDGGGKISVAEFGTLVRFLFTVDSKLRQRFDRHAKPDQRLTNRQIYLLLACIDVSSDHRIAQQEFLRFFFVVWSTRLMEVQDQLFQLEHGDPSAQVETPHGAGDQLLQTLTAARRKLRRALRTNFSRPFRDAMRCLSVAMPSPFTGLLAKLHLIPDESSPLNVAVPASVTAPVQVWQVLKDDQQPSSRPRGESATSKRPPAMDTAHRTARMGKNEILRTKLTRQREPTRADAALQTPPSRVALDEETRLKLDRRKR